jgi:hypothetical protein
LLASVCRSLRIRRLMVVLAAAGAALLVPIPAQAAPPYANCTAVWQQIGRPIFPQDSGYNFSLDADRDGVGCESKPSGVVAMSPPYGQARSDTWVSESFSAWPVPVALQGASRAVKIAKAARVQVNVTELVSENAIVWARNATPVNSGTASSVKQVTPRVGAASASTCAAPARMRVRTSISVRWTDGTLSNINVLGPLSAARWCRP